jgi:DNA phosphorothioation-associated putative methyltransferase
MQLLERFGFLNQEKTVFDYGCGKGDDVRNLKANAITANGWDPHFAPLEEKIESDIVNLGFVINVIENINERRQALSNAYQLATELLVVSAMIYNQNSFKGRQFEDGVLTSRHTFQKYFTQAELKEFIDHTLSADAIAVGVGIFFVFKDADAEQKFQSGRQRSRSKLIRLVERQKTIKPPSKREERYQERLAAIQNLRLVWLTLGRQPFKDEVQDLELLEQTFGSFAKAIRFMMEETDKDVLMQAQNNRLDDLLVYFALYSFSRKKPYRHLEQGLQRDIKVFFGDYEQAITQGKKLLFALADTAAIEKSCKQASEKGLGFYDNEKALHVISDNVELLPPMLRVYVGCGAMLYGDISRADMIKVHVHSGKLSILRYDDFAARLPKLMERVKIKLRVQDFDYFEYGEEYEPTYLYFKSKYLNEEHPDYAEQLAFDEQLESLSLFDFSGYGPKPSVFHQVLANSRWQVNNNQLVRSQKIPNLDDHCGSNFTYRDLIECGETWQKIKINNNPIQADSYTALYELAKNILDPVIDYYGMISLTYGFASSALTKHIKGRIAPKLDQHSAYEKNKKNEYICPRLGAAVDFIVEDENMLEVVEWIKDNLVFDRLYFYGVDRPIHISYNYLKLKTSLAFATQGQEQIVYVDEAHIHLDTDEGYGWTVKGQRAWISSHSPNFAKVSFYGVYFYNQGKVQIHAFDKADSHNTMKVLQKIRETFDADKSITLIWDNAPYHRSVQTKQAAQDLNIRLMPLPAYSPDFMPVEHLWRWLREEVTYHRCYEHESTLIARVNVFEQSINTDPTGIADRLWTKTTLNDDEEKLRFSD